MTFRAKKTIACTLLALVCIWPLGHFAMVRTFGLNPWKWFGWAMYTVPPGRVRANAFDLETRRAIDLNRIPRADGTKVLRAYKQFSDHRMEFGRRTPPDVFARAIFRAYPSIDGLLIEVQDVGVNRETAMIEELALVEYEYKRADLLE